MATKKDYEAIARIVRETNYFTKDNVAIKLADYFTEDNPNFNKTKFGISCGREW